MDKVNRAELGEAVLDVRRDSYDVAVTQPLLTLALLMRAMANVFQLESSLARQIGEMLPRNWAARAEDMFFQEYRKEAARVGLALNRATFLMLVQGAIPEELSRCEHHGIDGDWVFNPHRGWRKVK